MNSDQPSFQVNPETIPPETEAYSKEWAYFSPVQRLKKANRLRFALVDKPKTDCEEEDYQEKTKADYVKE